MPKMVGMLFRKSREASRNSRTRPGGVFSDLVERGEDRLAARENSAGSVGTTAEWFARARRDPNPPLRSAMMRESLGLRETHITEPHARSMPKPCDRV